MRFALSLVVLVALVVDARAEATTDRVVLGPAVDAKLSAARAKLVQTAIVQANVGKANDRKLDGMCANDAVCLGIIGADLKMRQVLAIIATAKTVTFILVDVADKELLGKREVVLPDGKLARELPAALKKFIDEVPLDRAKALFTQGNQHYSLGEFGPALEFYKRAYRIKQLPAFLFNIAQCHRKLDQHREAVTMYQSYLAGVPDAQNKNLVESLIKESQDKLAEEARVADEKEHARREAERLETERKRAEAERLAKEADAIAAAERTKQARLVAERERELEKTYNQHPFRKWAFVGGGVGALAMLAGGAFGLAARGAQSAFDDAGCGDPVQNRTGAVLAQCRADLDRGERNALLANAFLVGAAVTVAASAVVFLVDPGNVERPRERRAPSSVSAQFARGGAGELRAEVRIAPTSVQVVIRW